MHTRNNTLVAALVAALAVAPAFAGNGHGKGGEKQAGKQAAVQKHGGKSKAAKQVRRDDGRRHAYSDGRRHVDNDTRVMGSNACPPGLAKKDNGCMPPGQAKKVIVGEAIPPGAVYTIPPHVLSTVPPPPAGYRYAIVGNQLVLVSSGNVVVDIIRSLLG